MYSSEASSCQKVTESAQLLNTDIPQSVDSFSIVTPELMEGYENTCQYIQSCSDEYMLKILRTVKEECIKRQSLEILSAAASLFRNIGPKKPRKPKKSPNEAIVPSAQATDIEVPCTEKVDNLAEEKMIMDTGMADFKQEDGAQDFEQRDQDQPPTIKTLLNIDNISGSQLSTSQPSTPKKKDYKRKRDEMDLQTLEKEVTSSKGKLSNFFSIVRKANTLTSGSFGLEEKGNEDTIVYSTAFDEYFRPFFVKADMIIAKPRQKGIRTASNIISEAHTDAPLYLSELKTARSLSKAPQKVSWKSTCHSMQQKMHEHGQILERIRLGACFLGSRSTKRATILTVQDDDDDDIGTNIQKYSRKDQEFESQLVTTQLPLIRFKLYQFHDNYRPAYFGSWTKCSIEITPRRPFYRDMNCGLNYDVDSDEEWEEDLVEGDAEDLVNSSEDEDEEDLDGSEEEEEEEEDWLVPHGYLSDDEGITNEESQVLASDPQLSYDGHKKKRMQQISQKTNGTGPKTLVPKVIGPIYGHTISGSSHGYTIYELERLASCSFTFLPPIESIKQIHLQNHEHSADLKSQCGPVSIDPFHLVYSSALSSSGTSNVNSNNLQPQTHVLALSWNSSLNVQLGSLDSSSPGGPGKKFKFLESWEESLAHLVHHSTDGIDKLYEDFKKIAPIPKRQFVIKISEMAIKERRSPSVKLRWYIRQPWLDRFSLPIESDVSQVSPSIAPIEPSIPAKRRITPQVVVLNSSVPVSLPPIRTIMEPILPKETSWAIHFSTTQTDENSETSQKQSTLTYI
jgi:hypothetical protein